MSIGRDLVAGRRESFKFALILILFVLISPLVSAQEDADEGPDNAVALFNQAQDLHEKGKFEEAIKLYDKAIELVAEFPEAQYQRGDAYLSVGRLSDAEKSVRLAVQHRADWSLALAKLGEILVRKHSSASEQDAAAIRKEASDVLRRAVESDKSNFPAYAALVELQLNSNETDSVLQATLGSIKSITEGKMSVPASIWAARAALEDRLKLRDASRSSIKRAIDADAKSRSVMLLGAQFALSDGDVDLAASRLAELKRSGEQNATVRLLEARILASSGKYSEARKLLDESGIKSAEAEKFRAELAAHSSMSTAELEALLAKEPKNVSYLARLCEKLRVPSPEKAIDYCRRAAEADQENIAHAVGLGGALVQARKFDEAIILLNKLVLFVPGNLTVRANLATSYSQLKRYREAKPHYAWIVENHPERPIGHFLLAVTHDNLGEYLDAMANYQQFLRVADPATNGLEIEKVNLRMPALEKLIKSTKGKK
jgi:tetratricopeptide (TPR) repeat protein